MEGIREIEAMLDEARTSDPRKAAEFAYVLSALHLKCGDLGRARRYGDECLSLLDRSRLDTLEDCAPYLVTLGGIALPNIFHEDVVRNRLHQLYSAPKIDTRRIIIGVMGGNGVAPSVANDAKQIGRNVVKQGMILLTGGRPKDNNNVKNAAMFGAEEEERSTGTTARLIGILSKDEQEDPCGKILERDRAHPARCFLNTNLMSLERDPITGITPDVLIFLEGGKGSLCELAFALQAGKPVFFWDALETLRRYLTDNSSVVKAGLKTALEASQTRLTHVDGITVKTTVDQLFQLLEAHLKTAKDFGDDDSIKKLMGIAKIEKLVKTVIAQAQRTGFPGLSGFIDSQFKFERIVHEISEL